MIAETVRLPWTSQYGVETVASLDGFVPVVDGAGDVVAYVPQSGPGRGNPVIRQAATVALIVAAPDLLASLLALEAGVRMWIEKGVSMDELHAAQAAISKSGHSVLTRKDVHEGG